ncbi:UNVERIFIED_CONTAM: hypothetical protein RMT77_011256 [Armadillidium vulgare]
MICLYLFIIIICNFRSNAQFVEIFNTSKIVSVGDEKGWSISANIRNDNNLTFYFNCSGCSAFKDWAGLDLDVNFFRPPKAVKLAKDFKNDFLLQPKPNQLFGFWIFGKYNLKYKNENLFKTDKIFSLGLDVIYEKTILGKWKPFDWLYINNELILGRRRDEKQYHCPTKLSDIRRTCHIFANSINYFVQSLEATIFFNYSQPNIYRGVFLTLIMQDFLQEIRSSDFKVAKVDENQWTLTDYGYYLEANETIQTNLTLVSNDLIRNPIPLSILLNEEILCGFYPRSHFSSCIFSAPFLTQDRENITTKEESYKTVHQNFVMLSIVIAFIVIFAIYAIVATYQLIIWRRHYDQMTLELWNKVQGHTDNNFDNFVPSEYANAVTNFNATPF